MARVLVDHRRQLANVVGLVRHIGGEDDLVGRHHRLGIVALEVALAALHDPAVGIGHVGLGLLVHDVFGRFWLAAALAPAASLLLGRPGVDLLLLLGPLPVGLAQETLMAGAKPGQATRRLPQVGGEFVTSALPEHLVLGGVDRLGLRQHGGNLRLQGLRGAVRRQRRVRLHLGPVQRHHPEPHQTRCMAQLQNLHKQDFQVAPVTLAEPRDHAVVGNLGAHDHPEPRVPLAQALDLAARSLPVRVGIDKEADHHPRRKRRRPGAALPVMRLECRQIHQPDGIQEKMDEVRVRNPVRHVHRKKKPLSPIRFAIEVRHIRHHHLLPHPRKSTRRGNQPGVGRSSGKQSVKMAILQQPP